MPRRTSTFTAGKGLAPFISSSPYVLIWFEALLTAICYVDQASCWKVPHHGLGKGKRDSGCGL